MEPEETNVCDKDRDHLELLGSKFCSTCGKVIPTPPAQVLLDLPIPSFGLPEETELCLYHDKTDKLFTSVPFRAGSFREVLKKLFLGITFHHTLSFRVRKIEVSEMEERFRDEKILKLQKYIDHALLQIGDLFLCYFQTYSKEGKFLISDEFYLKTRKEALDFEAVDIRKFGWSFEKLYGWLGDFGPVQIRAYRNHYLTNPADIEVFTYIRGLRYALEKNKINLEKLVFTGQPLAATISELCRLPFLGNID